MLRMAYGKKPTEVQLEKLIDHVVQQCLLAGVVVATVVADGEHRLIRRDGFGAAAKKFIDAMASDSSGVQGQTNEAKATRIAALCSTIITYTQPTASLNLAGAFVPPMIAQPEPAAATTGGGAAAAAAAGVAQHGDIGIKKFDGTPYAFEVCGHKPPYFTVKYEDGDQEQMTNEEIAPLLVKRPLFRAVGEGDADVDTSTSSTTTRTNESNFSELARDKKPTLENLIGVVRLSDTVTAIREDETNRFTSQKSKRKRKDESPSTNLWAAPSVAVRRKYRKDLHSRAKGYTNGFSSVRDHNARLGGVR